MDEKKELKIFDQQLRISSTPQVDPEGQTVVREFKTEAAASMRGIESPNAAVTGNVGNIPTVIQYSGKAGEMANAARTACVGCKHWDHKAWLLFLSRADSPDAAPEARQTMQTMRARIEKAVGPADAELYMKGQGICRVLSDWVEQVQGRDPFFWPVISWREATCPNVCRAGPHELNVVTPAEPFGLFSPVDMDAKKIGANRYDAILKTVQEQNKR
jgi:hypothetical protein